MRGVKSSFEDKLINVLAALTAEVHELHNSISAVKQEQTILRKLDQMEEKIMATQKELADDLKLVLAQQVKTQGEIATVQASVDTLKQQVIDLEAIIAAGGTGVSQELIDAVAAVKAQAQIIDDAIPDVPTPA